MERKLIPMIDYIESQREKAQDMSECVDFACNVCSYAEFLKQPVTLGMFFPVGKDGNPLEKPPQYDRYLYRIWRSVTQNPNQDWLKECETYNEALDNVLFEGFVLDSENTIRKDNLTICLSTYQFIIEGHLGYGGGDINGEDLDALSRCDLDLIFTENAIKKLNI